MFTFVLLVALWVVVGLPLAVRSYQERKTVPMEQFQRAIHALQGPGPTADGPISGKAAALQAAARRRLVSTFTYLPGAVIALIGAIRADAATLAAAVVLVNLGTAHRLLAVRLDRKYRRRARRLAQRYVLTPAPAGAEPYAAEPFSAVAVDPGVDEAAGDGQTWGDGWQIIRPEPGGIDDLVLVDADVS
jgi:hypothetical protein